MVFGEAFRQSMHTHRKRIFNTSSRFVARTLEALDSDPKHQNALGGINFCVFRVCFIVKLMLKLLSNMIYP